MHAEASSTQTPFLVPCYVRPHAFHPLALFEDRKPPTADEHQLYAFEDSTTLADLSRSLLLSLPQRLAHPNARFAYRMVWFDGRVGGGFKMKDLDTISLSALKADDGTFYKTLSQLLFTPGTYLLLAIQNLPSAAAHPPQPQAGGPPSTLFQNALHQQTYQSAGGGGAGGWKSSGLLPPPERSLPDRQWTRGGLSGGRGGMGRGGMAIRRGANGPDFLGSSEGRGGFDGSDRGGGFGGRGRGGWGASDRGGFQSRGGGGGPANGFGGLGGLGGPDKGFNGRPAGNFSGGREREGAGWGERERRPPPPHHHHHQQRSVSPDPRRSRRDDSPPPVVLRGARRPSPTY